MDNNRKEEREIYFRSEEIVFFVPDIYAKINSLIMPYKAGISFPDPKYFIRRKKDWFSDNGYILEYVISGKGYIEYQDTVYPVKAGDFYLINRGVRPCYYYPDPDDLYCKIWINGVGRLFNALIYAYNINDPVLIVPCPDIYECFLRIHEILKKCNEENIRQHYAELVMEITKFFVVLDKAREQENLQARDTVVDFRAVTRFIRDNITNPNLNVEFIAHSFFISRTTLYRLFRKNMGFSVQEYIEQAKIEYAKNTFSMSDCSVARMAELLQYKDTRYFRNAFKRIEGISPTEWKQKHAPKPTKPN